MTRTRYAKRPAPNPKRTDGTTPNRYAGTCSLCRGPVAERAGNLRRNPLTDRYEVTHRPPIWTGSPVSGSWSGGCPTEWTNPE